MNAEQRRRMKESCRELWLEKLLPCWSMTVASHAKYLVANPLIRECMAAQVRVRHWPEWKRNILTDSASPTVRVPRKPVVIIDGGGSDD